MKKLILILASVATIFGISSCSQEDNVCNIALNGQNVCQMSWSRDSAENVPFTHGSEIWKFNNLNGQNVIEQKLTIFSTGEVQDNFINIQSSNDSTLNIFLPTLIKLQLVSFSDSSVVLYQVTDSAGFYYFHIN